MAINPKFAAHIYSAAMKPKRLHILEFYLDFACPFSAKMWKSMNENVIPYLEKNKKDQAEIIFKQLPQPWHPSSILMHEAALAVEQVDPSKFWDFSTALFQSQKEYFDVNVVNETRNQTYKRLSELAASSVGLEAKSVYELLEVADKPNGDSYNTGNKVTNDLKLVIKTGRQVSAHVTPTVYVNGYPDQSISSGWSADQWSKWINDNIV